MMVFFATPFSKLLPKKDSLLTIAEPREYYLFHRKPKIIEVNKEKTEIIVAFTKLDSYYGGRFGDTCSYKNEDGKWDIYD